MFHKVVGKRTTADVVDLYGKTSKDRLLPFFRAADVQFPPEKVTLLAIKDSNLLELWAENGEVQTFIRSYPVLAASGVLGPKLREGDKQVPEGIYQLEYLNPNSAFHLSMKLNYPNDFDLKHAKEEGRTEPGTNIFIHGKAFSIGCLAMGDEVAEELFVLTTLVGKANVNVAIAPSDPRMNDISKLATDKPQWVKTLYLDISTYFERFRHDN
ncbi:MULTISPECIES: L,D-transpeptidase family protein [Pseudoalteromonas]|nr:MULTISPECIES: L,D-transpeptidase family protein [Pseudoalteromonas]MCG7550443.1 L,D-transpeptidase family protein [Pseudoalteromonas sp. Of7M-16]